LPRITEEIADKQVLDGQASRQKVTTNKDDLDVALRRIHALEVRGTTFISVDDPHFDMIFSQELKDISPDIIESRERYLYVRECGIEGLFLIEIILTIKIFQGLP
jgi:hypothetical protein